MYTKNRANDFANFTRPYMQEGRVCTRQVARNARNGSENNVRIRSGRVGKGTEPGTGTGSELRGRSMLYMVADSLGPEDISQRSWSRSNPEGCSFSTPRNPSCLPPPPPRRLQGKSFSFTRASQEQACNSNEILSLFLVILAPSLR